MSSKIDHVFLIGGEIWNSGGWGVNNFLEEIPAFGGVYSLLNQYISTHNFKNKFFARRCLNG